jgi:FkbM family methyltransferase
VTVLQAVGRVVTRLLLRPGLRERPLAAWAYTRAYLAAKQLAEWRQQRFLLERLRPGMVVFDVGSNVGYYTLAFAQRVGPQGAVHAFEPDPFTFGILERRVARAGCTNVALTSAAVGDHEGTVSLHCGAVNRADNRIHASHPPGESAEVVEVPLLTLDDYCTRHGVDRIDAVKMDIQGAEVGALRGFAESLRRLRPEWLFLELHEEGLRGAGATSAELFAELEAAGLEPWAFDSRQRAYAIDDTVAFAAEHRSGYTDVWARRPGAG